MSLFHHEEARKVRALKIDISGALLLEMCGIPDAEHIEVHAAWVAERDTLTVVFAGADFRLPEVEIGNAWPEGMIECRLKDMKGERPGIEGKFVVFKKQYKP